MRRNVLVSCAVFVLLLTGLAAGAAACQITCPDGDPHLGFTLSRPAINGLVEDLSIRSVR